MNDINATNAETAAPFTPSVVLEESNAASVHPIIATAPEVTSYTSGLGVTTPVITDSMVIDYLKDNDPLVLALKQKFERALNNLDFLKDDSWVEHASNGLNKPNIDDRLGAQTETFVKKDLRNKAAVKAEAGEPYVAPTAADIAKEVDLRLKNRKDEIKAKQDRKVNIAKLALSKK